MSRRLFAATPLRTWPGLRLKSYEFALTPFPPPYDVYAKVSRAKLRSCPYTTSRSPCTLHSYSLRQANQTFIFLSFPRSLKKSPLTSNHGIPDERHPLKHIQIRGCPASERTQAPLVIEIHPLIVRARHIGRVYRGAVVRDECAYDRRWLGN